ncbi:MAG: cytochrome P450 [Myxococcales bacterium]|nr:cytochrome P450 [Myxococcales bacterium]
MNQPASLAGKNPAPRAADRRPPGPPPRRGPFGSLHYYYRFLTDSIGFVRERFELYGDIYCAPTGDVPLFVLRHPDHLWEVLVRDAGKYGKTHSGFDLLQHFLGQSLLTTDGEVWRRQRRMCQPAFDKQRLADYATAMVDETRNVGDGWNDGETYDISREMMRMTLRVVCRTLFSHDVGGKANTVAHAMDAFRTAFELSDLLPPWLSPWQRRGDRAKTALDEIIYAMIDDRRKASSSPEPPDLLHMLLTAIDYEGDGGGLSDKEVRDQLVTMFLAGHDTTSHALTWTWYLLSQNPDAERTLHAELDDVLGGRLPTYADLDKLSYTRWCFEEAMRIYPPAYTIARRAEADATIGGYEVPRGSEVVMWIYMTHQDSRWYPNPRAFIPERFSPEQVAKRPKLAYLPFAAGSRACIGKVFAAIEGQLVLATLAQRFRLRHEPGHKVAMAPRITLAPKHGMRMIVTAR